MEKFRCEAGHWVILVRGRVEFLVDKNDLWGTWEKVLVGNWRGMLRRRAAVTALEGVIVIYVTSFPKGDGGDGVVVTVIEKIR